MIDSQTDSPQSSTSVPSDTLDGADRRRSALAGRGTEAAEWCRDHKWSLGALVGSLVVFLAVTVASIAEHAPLGHDESVYANRGRFFAGDLADGAGYWANYRAPGISFVLGLLFRVSGPSDALARIVVVGFGVVAVIAVYVLATALIDPAAGAAAAVLLVLSSGFTRHAALIFVDVPGMAIPMVAITTTYLLWRGGRLHPAAYAVVPVLAMIATYIRFGAPATLAPGLAGIVIILATEQWRTRAWAFVRETVTLATLTGLATAVVLLVPWFTAQPVAPLRAQQTFRDAKGIPMLDSVEDLLAITWPNGEPQDFFHPLVFWSVAVLMIVAIVASIWIPRIRPGAWFGTGAALVTVVGLNVNLSLIAPQYLVLVVPYVVIAAGAGFSVVAALVAGRDLRWRALVAVPVAVGVSLGVVALNDDLQGVAGTLSSSFDPIRDAGFAVRAQGVDDCVVLTGTSPQVGWYADCRMAGWGSAPLREDLTTEIGERVGIHDLPMTVYVVDILNGKREPDSESFDVEDAPLTLIAVIGTPEDGGRRYVRVFETDACVPRGSCGG